MSSPRCGAVATFIGVVRDHNAGRRVEWLDYEAYPALAVKTFERIGSEAEARWRQPVIVMPKLVRRARDSSPRREDCHR